MYAKAFRPRYSESFEDWILRRLAAGEKAPDPLDDLIDEAPPKVLDWMRRKARLADGSVAAVARPLVPWEDLLSAFEAQEDALRNLAGATDVRDFARAGLLRDVAGLALVRIGAIVGCTPSTVCYRIARHRALLARPDYGPITAEITTAALSAFR